MKSFFRTLLAVIVGILVYQMIMGLIFFGIVSALVSAKPTVSVDANSVLRIGSDIRIVEHRRSGDVDYQALMMDRKVEPAYELLDVLEVLDHAAEDDHIIGISLDLSGIHMGMATLREFREGLERFRRSGKFIYGYSYSLEQGGLYLGSVCDSLFIHPEGEVSWTGFASITPYFKRGFDKYGIEAQVIRHGKFKSAVEPFMTDVISEANALQMRTYLNSLWGVWRSEVARARGVSEGHLDRIANERMMLLGEEAVEWGMVDGVRFTDEYEDLLEEAGGGDYERASWGEYVKYWRTVRSVHRGASKVAVLFADGTITMGDDISKGIQAEAYREEIKDLREDESIKAVVFRVNSPGGSALASDIIWRELELLNREKPLVVSMGDYAASGGYYISAPARAIVASPSTVTGSIGVYGVVFNITDLLVKRLGITPQIVQTNDHSAAMPGALLRKLTQAEKARVQESVEKVYGTFIGRVSAGRGLSTDSVDAIGQGRVWAGGDALNLGLVDTLGGIRDAIALAAEMAELESYRPISYPIYEASLMDQFLEGFAAGRGGIRLPAWARGADVLEREREEVLRMIEGGGIRAELPMGRVIF